MNLVLKNPPEFSLLFRSIGLLKVNNSFQEKLNKAPNHGKSFVLKILNDKLIPRNLVNQDVDVISIVVSIDK